MFSIFKTGAHNYILGTYDKSPKHYSFCVLGGPPHLFLVVLATTTWPSSHLDLKVRTFFNSPGSVHFENDLIFNPSFNIRRVKAKTVNTMT